MLQTVGFTLVGGDRTILSTPAPCSTRPSSRERLSPAAWITLLASWPLISGMHAFSIIEITVAPKPVVGTGGGAGGGGGGAGGGGAGAAAGVAGAAAAGAAGADSGCATA